MSNRYKTNEEIEQERQEQRIRMTGNYPIARDKLALLYSRYSTKEQAAHGIKEGLEQSEKMIALALEHGWTRDLMKLFLENNVARNGKLKSVSGTIPIEQRGKLSTLVDDYVNKDIAGAIFCDDVSRLTRDADLVDATTLARACRKHNVVIITTETVYDLRRENDYKAFIEEAAAAASWRKTHLFGKMLRNRTRRAESGKVANGSAPIGLKLNATRDNYEPTVHADRVNWLYARYRAHSANLTALYNEIVHMSQQGIPLFPDDPSIDPKSVFIKRMTGGWTVNSRHGLETILTNKQYLGHLIFNGQIMKRDAFPAIVDPDLWHYANEHLGETDLNGNAIEHIKRTVRYEQKGSSNQALLAGTRDNGNAVIDGLNGQHVYVTVTDEPIYILKDRTGFTVSAYEASIRTRKLDAIIEDHILCHLRTSQRLEDRNAYTVLGIEHKYTPAVAARAVEGTKPAVAPKTVQDALNEAQEELAKTQRRIDTAGDLMTANELRAAYEKRNRLQRRVDNANETIEQASRIARQQEQGKRDVQRAHDLWTKWSIDEKRQFIRLVTDAIYLEKQADGALRLTLVWSPLMCFVDPMEGVTIDRDIAYIHRIRNKTPRVVWRHNKQPYPPFMNGGGY